MEEADDEDTDTDEDTSKGNASYRRQQTNVANDAITALEATDDASDDVRKDVKSTPGKANGSSGGGGGGKGLDGAGGGGYGSSSSGSSNNPLRKDASNTSLDSNGDGAQQVRRLTSEQEQVRAQKFQRKRPSKATNVDDHLGSGTGGNGSSSHNKIGGAAAAEEDDSGSDDDGGSVVGVAMGSPGAGSRGGSRLKGPNGQFVQKLDSVEFGSIMDTLASQPVNE